MSSKRSSSKKPPEHNEWDEGGGSGRRRSWTGIILTGVFALLAFSVLAIYTTAPQGTPPRIGVGSALTEPGEIVDIEPWTYDAENDRHWFADHNHWHDGPPPEDRDAAVAAAAAEQTPAPTPGSSPLDTSLPTPEPWTYDAENDRHWFAEHNHWHDGPPPPESERP
ncbi:MAG: hypothetical protein WD114_00575 [Phycisphaerales bacterium]